MPKASKAKSATARKDPISKPLKDSEDAEPPKRSRGRPRKTPKEDEESTVAESKDSASTSKATKQDPKASHLYTDDNPSTTLHGTGFKDAATAERTLSLVSKRSLTYQFQTVNTMYHRAKHHPSMKGGETARNADIRAAMGVFKQWLDVTYPAAKDALREGGGFKPMLSKGYVEKHLSSIKSAFEGENDAADGVAFAEMYASLGRNKRLGNVLLDDSEPEGPDWEVRRYEALCRLVPEGKEWTADDLWERGEKKAGLSRKHLQVVGWAWSSVQERSLP